MKRIIPFFTFLLMATAVLAADTRCYELRIYTANKGKMEALNARFRNHTCKLFEKHGLTNVGYWVPVDSMWNETNTNGPMCTFFGYMRRVPASPIII